MPIWRGIETQRVSSRRFAGLVPDCVGKRSRPGVVLVKRSCVMLLVVGLVAGLFAAVASAALAADAPTSVIVSNGKIAFTGDGPYPLKYDVWVMDPDGSNPTRLQTQDRLEKWPSWSPDGTQIAHEASIPMALMYGWLGVMDETGNALQEIWGGEGIRSRPAWSPDGGSIVISWGYGDSNRVIKIPLDGTLETTLVDHDSRVGSWSPDGSRIALSSKAFGLSTWQIVLIDPDGTNPSILTPGGVGGLVGSYAPAWSPDGTRIAFGGVGLATVEDIWIMNADGSSKSVLAANGRNPEWSPDGTMILFERDGAPYVVPAGGGAATVLPNWTLPAGLTSAGQFDWQPVFETIPPTDTFVDDDSSVFEADIEWMAAEGITKGCNPPANDWFCPDAVVTRGQMAAFLVRALGLTERLNDPFVDDDGSIFEADIERLAAAGITKGCSPPVNDRFCPDGKVTREQMAAFLVRALGYTDDGGGNLFIDDDDSIFEADIDRLGTVGVTRGCNPPTNDRFCPTGNVTRGQMAAFLHRALG